MVHNIWKKKLDKIFSIIILFKFIRSVDVEAQIPLRLREGDVITMGTTELVVHVTDLEDVENSPPEII